MAGRIEARLKELGIELPQASKPAAAYVPWRISGKQVWIAGQVPLWNGELKWIGKVGDRYTVQEGYEAAKLCGLNILAQLKAACGGDLDRVAQAVKLVGFVNCPPTFGDQPKVVNGASELMVQVFGPEAGAHARSAVGMGSLPFDVAVEVEGVFELA
jgi:enamine deaminase RidA (YjgF/YER057c/UK114 family)